MVWRKEGDRYDPFGLEVPFAPAIARRGAKGPSGTRAALNPTPLSWLTADENLDWVTSGAREEEIAYEEELDWLSRAPSADEGEQESSLDEGEEEGLDWLDMEAEADAWGSFGEEQLDGDASEACPHCAARSAAAQPFVDETTWSLLAENLAGEESNFREYEPEWRYSEAETAEELPSGSLFENEGGETQQAAKCRKVWEQFLAGLSVDVRQALSKGDYGIATIMAIHHGLRDLNKLTNMIFFSSMGSSRGFCPIKPGEREPGGGKKKMSEWWIEYRNKYVIPALSLPSPKLPQGGPIACEKIEIGPAKDAPETPSIDLTGTYEVASKNKSSPQLMRINQAGNHIEAVFRTSILPGDDCAIGKPGAATVFMAGDRQANGNYTMTSPSRPGGLSFLYPTAGAVELFEPDGTSYKFRRVKAGAAHLTPDFAKASSPLAQLHEQRPLTSTQIAWLKKRFATQAIEPFLIDFSKQSSQDLSTDKHYLIGSGGRFDTYLRDTFYDANWGICSVDRGDAELSSFYARCMLSANKWAVKNLTRSHLDWVQDMHGRMLGAGSQGGMLYGVDWLKLTRDAASTIEHEYQVEVDLSGIGFGVHYYRGDVTVTKLSGGGAWAKGEKHTFPAWVAGVKAGVQMGFKKEGRVKTRFEWLPQDFPGSLNIVLADGSVTIGPVGVEGLAGFIQIEGNRRHPMLTVEFKDAEIKVDPRDIPKRDSHGDWDVKFEASIGPGGFLGKIRDKPFPPVDYSTPAISTDYVALLKMDQNVHFCLNSALLTEDARQALRIMIGKELPAFLSPGARVDIVGHTDSSEPPPSPKNKLRGAAFNKLLSELRARNTAMAIHDIVGSSRLAAALKPVGKGQAEADAAGGPKVNPAFRRVDVFLNSRLVLSLRAD